ncbi:zinc finger CCHC domain-containing protein 7 [Arvicanthis niloticus]|uniref:zinc finger CCHC domain-containing protein 7 n=1 Tax=Arvicanthis niloticus TaxID=61156 RepID=UPI0014874236|nr:zinc finger CCHC domain-containing protein 7 [Arvicanthis niloticus]XP_034357802.1 zinc finger CCHC domain-containing protein 7 [Arvicanthis niloticus]XP_034357803.1 zinc finger CCHC domain-containing protein 7 [Arvicanthis niloticus]
MFGGYETIEAFEDDLYRDDSSSELSVDSEVEFQLYSQVHYAQNIHNANKEEGYEEKNCENSETESNQPNQKNLIVLSDSEVIQLSDTSEVITLSDEDSIYRCKKKNVKIQAQEKTQSSAPHFNKVAKKCKRDNEKPEPEEKPNVIREVMIIEVSSNEEEESTISENENVESWMLLGCEEDDKDHDILLNLVGCENTGAEGEDDVNWFISDKDMEAKIDNNKSSGRWNNRYYSANKNVTCRNCDKRGHLSKNCPLPQKVRPCCLCSERGHLQYGCPARYCLDCSLPMSSTHRCFERSSWRKRCDRCDMIGHYADACPEIWRQYHLTTKPGPPKKPKTPSGQSALVYCYNCAQKGHYGHECTERRMFNQTFPTSPFIYYYDSKYDIQQRDWRIKRKMKDIKKNGDFPRQFKRPHVEKTDERRHHDMRKNHSSRKRSRWPQENKETQKEKTRSREGKTHRRDHQPQDEDEDFPRGSKPNSSGSVNNQKPSRSRHHASHYHRLREEKFLRESKRSKPKKRKCAEDGSRDDLFLIKQRKKRPKPSGF